MSLVVLTGPVRSGKSAAAELMATERGSRVTVAVAGWDGDEEMERRIRAHREARPERWDVRLVGPEASWVADVPSDAVLVLDCLATLVGTIAHEATGEGEVASADAERDSQSRCDALVEALTQRAGDTVVVTNEAGWGVVPSSASGRLFRDLLGRANRTLIAAADAAYLVVGGRLLDLSCLPAETAWPTGDRTDPAAAPAGASASATGRTDVTDEQFLAETIAAVPAPDPAWEERAWARLDSLTKPPRSLGYLEKIAQRIAVLQRTERPAVPRKAIVLMAGDHGVTAEGISPYPSEVTVQMVANFSAGGAAINQLAKHAGARVVVVDVGVANPLLSEEGVVRARVADGTANMAKGPAMTRVQAAAAVRVGIETVRRLADEGLDLVGTGDMGIGNTTASAAIASVLTGVDPADVVGPGTGLDAGGIGRKAEVIRRALALNAPDPADPLDVLAKVGGLEIAGLAGVVIGAAACGIPVVSDGFISGVATLAALRLAPSATPWVFASHRSAEPGHRVVLEALGVRPVLELDMRLGEGTGAALAMEIIDAACAVMSGMATFAEAGVSGRED